MNRKSPKTGGGNMEIKLPIPTFPTAPATTATLAQNKQ